MNQKTERKLRQITAEVAKKCGIETALVDRPDPQQTENKEKAKEILLRTRLPNSWTTEENTTMALQMQKVIDEPVRMVKTLDAGKQAEYDRILEYRIKKAIRLGEIPDPKKDRDMKKMIQLYQK